MVELVSEFLEQEVDFKVKRLSCPGDEYKGVLRQF